MAARKPKIEFYWAHRYTAPAESIPVVNWRLVGANGEVMCQSTQGFRDKTDALRSVILCGQLLFYPTEPGSKVRITGPGRKLNA